MSWDKIDWDRWDVIALGRSAGLLIIVIGVLLSGWQALDEDFGSNSNAARAFLFRALSSVSTGGILLLVAEIAERLGWMGGAGEGEAGGETPAETPGDGA